MGCIGGAGEKFGGGVGGDFLYGVGELGGGVGGGVLMQLTGGGSGEGCVGGDVGGGDVNSGDGGGGEDTGGVVKGSGGGGTSEAHLKEVQLTFRDKNILHCSADLCVGLPRKQFF